MTTASPSPAALLTDNDEPIKSGVQSSLPASTPAASQAAPESLASSHVCPQEPQMFHIGSDDGSCADEHSDTDFFPDLHEGCVVGAVGRCQTKLGHESDEQEDLQSSRAERESDGESDHEQHDAKAQGTISSERTEEKKADASEKTEPFSSHVEEVCSATTHSSQTDGHGQAECRAPAEAEQQADPEDG